MIDERITKYFEKIDLGKGYTVFTDFESALIKTFGRSYANKVFSEINHRDSTDDFSQEYFYSLKNDYQDKSMFVTGAFDRSFFERVCSFICDHPELFKGEILDVGCDTGILSCFIAWIYPKCHVTAIDLLNKGLKIARNIAKKLSISNISFVQQNIMTYEAEQLYDTVFTSRCVQEIIETYVSQDIIPYDPTYKTVENSAVFNPVRKICSFLKEGGIYVAAERAATYVYTDAYLYAMADSGCEINFELSRKLECNTMVGLELLQMMVGCKNHRHTTADEIVNRNLPNEYDDLVKYKYIDPDASINYDSYANMILYLDGKKLECGVISYKIGDTVPVSIHLLVSSKSHSERLYRFTFERLLSECRIESINISNLEARKKAILHRFESYNEENGWKTMLFPGNDAEKFKYPFDAKNSNSV